MADGILDNRETDMTKSQVMDIAMDMGRILLKSGAETSRVEDTMMRFCRSHGYYDLNVFCTPTIIILGDESAHGKSRVFRVRWRAVDLGLIMDINNLSYNFKRWGMTYKMAKEWMRERIRQSHPYGNLGVCLASGVGSAAFTMLLGGNGHDFAASFLCGFVAMGILKLLNRLHPTAFLPQNLFLWQQILFRLVASFCGVFGFSMMFNSPLRLAAAAGLIGAFSNTLRLELVDLCSMAPAAAAFLGAFCSGLAASAIKGLSGFPRIALTVPSIVIMVPGLYLYKSFYNLGVMNLTGALQWLCMATLIVLALPLGLVAARILTDRNFRHCT